MDDLNYLLEKNRKEFQASITGLLEMHAGMAHKLTHAKQTSKQLVCTNVAEFEIVTNYILTTVVRLMSNYDNIINTNKLLKLGNILLEESLYGAASHIIDDYKLGIISKDEFKKRLDEFMNHKQPTSV